MYFRLLSLTTASGHNRTVLDEVAWTARDKGHSLKSRASARFTNVRVHGPSETRVLLRHERRIKIEYTYTDWIGRHVSGPAIKCNACLSLKSRHAPGLQQSGIASNGVLKPCLVDRRCRRIPQLGVSTSTQKWTLLGSGAPCLIRAADLRPPYSPERLSLAGTWRENSTDCKAWITEANLQAKNKYNARASCSKHACCRREGVQPGHVQSLIHPKLDYFMYFMYYNCSNTQENTYIQVTLERKLVNDVHSKYLWKARCPPCSLENSNITGV